MPNEAGKVVNLLNLRDIASGFIAIEVHALRYARASTGSLESQANKGQKGPLTGAPSL
jgi:hypothetical protein